jgi:hypothetical protein
MTSSIPSKLSRHRLLAALIGAAALSANIALAAEPVPDTQELARQFILGTPAAASPAPTPVADAARADIPAYVRQFILGTPSVELLAESNRQARGFTPAPAAQVDSQEQVRQFILGLAQRGDPSRGA